MTYFSRDFTAEQAKVVIADYVQDLSEFAVCDIEDAIRQYRRDPLAEFFPKPGRLCELCSGARSDRIARENCKPGSAPKNLVPEFGESRPIRWWDHPKQLWRPHWKESEIPMAEVKLYQQRLDRNPGLA